MVAVPLELPDLQAEHLRKLAERSGLSLDMFIRRHILDRLDAESNELEHIADRVFEKNDELLRRLA